MKTFVLTVSRTFPKTHKRSENSTYFVEKILNATNGWNDKNIELPLVQLEDSLKIHTIRSNYKLWKSRIDQVNEGKAVLSLRYWTGSPYNYKRDGSKQQEFLQLKKRECSIQKIEVDMVYQFKIDDGEVEWGMQELSKNDGLSVEDFKEWFKDYNPKPMAIIHFTNFRY